MIDVIFLQFLNGLDKGAAYALIALGLTLVFGTLGVVNFAHGALFMLGAFCAVLFRQFLTLETVTVDPEQLSPWGTPLEVREPLVQAWFGDWGAVLVNYSVPVSIIVTIPIMLVYGDWDAVRTSHAAKFFELLGGGLQDAGWDGSGMNQNRLAIIPGLTHYTMVSPQLAATALGFIDGQ